MKFTFTATGAISAYAILMSAAAYAQGQQDEARGGFEEIIVTAQRRSQSIQDVPVAVTSISGQSLERAGVSDLRSLPSLAPSLNFAAPSGFSYPFLRGLGSDIAGPGAEPSVATFVDGVYTSDQQSLLSNLLGVERVEVLNGPQGTLFGRNASAGAITIYTLTPEQDFKGRVSATAGNRDLLQGSAHVSGGVTDRLALGVYIAGSRQESIFEFADPLPPGQPRTEKTWGARLKGVWEPIDTFKLTGSYEHTEFRTGDAGHRNGQPNAVGYSNGATRIMEEGVISSDVAQYVNTNMDFAHLRADADLGFANFVSISGYREVDSFVKSDNDGTNAPLQILSLEQVSRQFSQELQLLSPKGSSIEWIVGLYYFHEKAAFAPFDVISTFLFPPAFDTVSNELPYKGKSYAAFAQVTVPLFVDGFGLTLAGRYTHDRKNKLPSTVTRLKNGVAIAPGVVFPGAKKSWSKFTPKIGLEYKTGDTLYYATFSQGYKSGGFSPGSTDTTPVQPEEITNYEGGLKTDLLDRHVRLNLAAYYFKVKNLQFQVLTLTSGFTALLRNAASARAYGLEATVQAAISDRLTLNFNGAWQNSKYLSFDNAPFYILSSTGNTLIRGVSAAGLDLQRAPKFVMNASANYSIPLANGGKVEFDGSLHYNDGFKWNPMGQTVEPSRTRIDASIGYTAPDNDWSARLWVRNLGKTLARTNYLVSTLGIHEDGAAVRNIGLTLTKNF